MKKWIAIRTATLNRLVKDYPETGMNFQVVKTSPERFFIVIGGFGLPCYDDPNYYCVKDFIDGNPIPADYDKFDLNIDTVYKIRSKALD